MTEQRLNHILQYATALGHVRTTTVYLNRHLETSNGFPRLLVKVRVFLLLQTLCTVADIMSDWQATHSTISAARG
ncbi:hypothetical protein AG1IA_10475 [Rhizoctonia solani AG-1 IA]|uniref:Uncharacterized protein n=1 Tax=Thanatephorus cucumeris (strain AG1-IA) TaxID=983506 RepID=L8WC06_THACA|nr:hypothetical protein AG1IA_10475 [Rhizoctonia solani AG-1 IA]